MPVFIVCWQIVTIRTEDYIPPKKASRSEVVNAIRGLKPGKSLLISGEDLTDRTRSQVYKAASREGVEVRTQRTVVGLRVWLKDSERASIEQENNDSEGEMANFPEKPDYYPPESGQSDLRTKEQKQKYLAEYFEGKVDLPDRDAVKEIDEANAPEETRKIIYDE
jgi:hypothetical protein